MTRIEEEEEWREVIKRIEEKYRRKIFFKNEQT